MSRPQAISNCSLEFKEKPCVSLKFEVGPHTFELWCTLRHSFACHSNEGFLAKLLEIAQEYLLSKQVPHLSSSSSDGDSGNSSSTALPEGSATASAELPTIERKPRKPRPKAEQAGGDACRYCDGSHSQSECLVLKPEAHVYDSGHLDAWDGYCKGLEDAAPLARLSLPSCLALASEGVVAKVAIKPFTQFGPLVGPKVKEVDIRDDCNMSHIWELQLESGNVYIDTEDPQSSNWLRYVRPAPTRPERNLSAIVREEGLYLVSVRALSAGDELLYWQDTFGSDSRKRNDKTVCGGCNMTFGHPLHYKVHCSLFHDMRYSLTIRKYHCKVCGAAILGKENIRKHATEQHNGKGAYQCQFCGKFFLRLSYLEMHRTYGCSSNPQRSKSLCDFCGRNFCQPQKLKIHIKRMHSSLPDVLKDFQCKKCLKILGSRAALQRHTKEVHDKQVAATYGCTICAKHFQNKSNLKIHMLTHSGIKPFKCIVDECAAAFTTKQCLQLHYRKVHSFDADSMPKIERAVSYTFQAYSGAPKGQVKQQSFEDASSGDMFDSSIGLDRPPSAHELPLTSAQTLHTVEEIIGRPTAVKLISKGEKKWVPDAAFEEPKLASEFSGRDGSNASLLVEAALDSVCNDASLDIDVEVSHNCPDTGFGGNIYADVDYPLQESQDINLISPSVHDHISVTDEVKEPDNMDIQYGQLPEDHFRPDSRNSGASLAKEGALGHDANEPYGGQSPRRYDFVMNPDHLSSDESSPDDPAKPPDRPTLRVKSSIRMHDYFRRLWFEENNQAEAEVPELPDKPKYEQEMAADLRSRFEADLDSRVRHYEPSLDPELNRLNLIDADFRPERSFEPDLQGLDMSTRSFHNYSSNLNRYHAPAYPDLDLRLNYTPPPYDLVRVVSVDLTPPGRHSVDLSLRGLHQITNSRLLTDKHRLFDLTSRLGDINPPGGDQLGDCHLLPGVAVGGAFGGYSGVAQPGYAPMDPRAHGASPVNAGYHHPPYSTYYP